MTREEDIRQAVDVMRKGGVILYPTDTVWGIGCDATNKEAAALNYQDIDPRIIEAVDYICWSPRQEHKPHPSRPSSA